MSHISRTYAKDLDLNLLRVFVVVAEEGSITRAASRLYVTQPAVSDSMRRLSDFIGAKLFTRQGRGLVLTHRGSNLLAAARAHLAPLVEAAVAEPLFDPRASTALVRLGIDDGVDSVVLPALLARLRATAPRMKVGIVFVNCRNVEEMLLERKADVALCTADDALLRSVHREPLIDQTDDADLVCLYDGRYVKLPKRPTEKQYFAQAHVVISSTGDARGVVEDALGRTRDVRVSLPGFSAIADVVDGSPLVATIPAVLAAHFQKTRPHLRTAVLPFPIGGASIDLLWSRVADDDKVVQFLRGELRATVEGLGVRSPRSARAKSPR